MAQDWADTCKTTYNPRRKDPRWPSVGQNVAALDTRGTIKTMFATWEDEKEKYDYYGKSRGIVVHYKRIISAETTHLGCGWKTNCPGSERYRLVCNYGKDKWIALLSSLHYQRRRPTENCDD